MTPLCDLAAALRIAPREHVALVGGGGKTTTLAALGDQLGRRTLLTTTTKMGREQLGSFTTLTAPEHDELRAALDAGPVVVRAGVDRHKALGVTAQRCDTWFADTDLVDHLVVEADGARRRPFKAPRPLEPVIPSTTTLVVAHIGADALGRVIIDQCFRPMRVAAAAGCRVTERLTPERAATVLLSDRGTRAGVPAAARFVVVVTKVDGSNRAFVDELVDRLDGAAVEAIRIAGHD